MGVVGVVMVVVVGRIFHCCDGEGGDAVESRNEGEKRKPEQEFAGWAQLYVCSLGCR